MNKQELIAMGLEPEFMPIPSWVRDERKFWRCYDIYKKALADKLYEDDGIRTYRELIAATHGITKHIFYKFGFDKDPDIVSVIDKRAALACRSVLDKLLASDEAAQLKMAYMLLGDDDDIRKLTTNRKEITGKNGEPIQNVNMSMEDIAKYAEKVRDILHRDKNA